VVGAAVAADVVELIKGIPASMGFASRAPTAPLMATPEGNPRPSDFIDAQTALYIVVGALVIIHPPTISRALIGSLTAAYAISVVAAQYGFEADGVAVLATLLGLRAAVRVLKIALTLLATFPLTLSFPLVVDLIPRFAIAKANFFAADGASPEVAKQRKGALEALQKKWEAKYKQCLKFGSSLKTLISDVRFTSGRCFPPFSQVTNEYLDPSMALARTEGASVVDIDGNSALDISGSYGVNVCGYEAYKTFITKGWEAAKDKGLYLGSLDETTLENIKMIQEVSGLGEISFHMSGTEAVMAAVRCARFNKRRPLVVTFGGAYHGWWDGMQPAAGNERTPTDVLCLKDMNALSLAVIRARSSEIAAVLVNPLQCFHLNASPPSDLVLSSNNRSVGAKDGYTEWLRKLRKVCTDSDVLLIFDEVYTGFRIHEKGAQGAYGVQADIVTYGKTLGGGLPVGVCCGNKHAMTRADPKKAARVAYVIGTFAGHPAVMGSMNAFLKWHARPETPAMYVKMHSLIAKFVRVANQTFKERGFPLELANWFSVWSIMYTVPGRYHWMLQYYMRDAGVALSWVGTGRLLFALDWEQKDYDELLKRMLVACEEMKKGGWWEPPRKNVKLTVAKEFVSAIAKSLVGM
jgi:glutamate-1-semialdehyde 2,1-aminomutase